MTWLLGRKWVLSPGREGRTPWGTWFCHPVGGDGLSLPPLTDKEGDIGGVVKDKLKEDGPGGTSAIPIVEGIQPLPFKIVQKIDQAEFVDFADLLQDQFPTDEIRLPDHTGIAEGRRRKESSLGGSLSQQSSAVTRTQR